MNSKNLEIGVIVIVLVAILYADFSSAPPRTQHSSQAAKVITSPIPPAQPDLEKTAPDPITDQSLTGECNILRAMISSIPTWRENKVSWDKIEANIAGPLAHLGADNKTLNYWITYSRAVFDGRQTSKETESSVGNPCVKGNFSNIGYEAPASHDDNKKLFYDRKVQGDPHMCSLKASVFEAAAAARDNNGTPELARQMTAAYHEVPKEFREIAIRLVFEDPAYMHSGRALYNFVLPQCLYNGQYQ